MRARTEKTSGVAGAALVLAVILTATLFGGCAPATGPSSEGQGTRSTSVTSSAPTQTTTASTSSIGAQLSAADQALLAEIQALHDDWRRLDDLDAAAAVHTYFASGDPAVEFYLSAPRLRQVTTQPNAVPEREREGGIDNLMVEGPLSGVPSQVYSRVEWPEQLHFRVTYTSRQASSIGEPPGKRLWFVIIGRQTADSPWKVLEIGCGP